jgi:hypothetical protein
MWEWIRMAVVAVTATVIWFAVVTFGFGSQLWPFLMGVP